MPRSAFIIRPFGEKEVVLAGEETVLADGARARTARLVKVDFDKIHRDLIEPALRKAKMTAHTTGIVLASGNIREDMFHFLMTADLVVADITLHNPNVFYELGIRHAFRDKFTFLIRSSISEYPFDLKTDRYFEYDHLHPARSIEALAAAVRATMNSERSDSPVFRLLPRMRTEDRSRFISVPRDFTEEVDRAKKHRRGGDLRLLAAECDGFLWEVEGLREVGRAQFELNFMGGARNTWEEIARRYPDDVEANMILSTVYQRMSDGTRSEQALARISRLAIHDVNIKAEIRSLMGRNLKARWMASWMPEKPAAPRGQTDDDSGFPDAVNDIVEIECRHKRALRSPLLRKACEAYSESFRDNLNYAYAGLNALSLMITEVSLAIRYPDTWTLLAPRPEEAGPILEQRKREITRLSSAIEFAIDCERQRLSAEGRVDFWFEILEAAFLLLTSPNPKKVAQAYFEAMIWAPRYAESSMRRALDIYQLLDVHHFDPNVNLRDNVRHALEVIRREEEKKRPGHILLFVGLRMEPASNGAAKPAANEPLRFLPAHTEAKAKQAIRALVEAEIAGQGDVLFGMAAGENGGDILFHEVCAEMGIPTRLYLALAKDQYIGEYVAPAGEKWIQRFSRILRALQGSSSNAAPAQLDSEQVINVLADSTELPRWLQSKAGYTIGKRNQIWMLQHALVQRYLHDRHSTDVTLIALWDGKPVEGGIGDVVAMAEKNGLRVLHIDCSEWAQEAQKKDVLAFEQAAGRLSA